MSSELKHVNEILRKRWNPSFSSWCFQVNLFAIRFNLVQFWPNACFMIFYGLKLVFSWNKEHFAIDIVDPMLSTLLILKQYVGRGSNMNLALHESLRSSRVDREPAPVFGRSQVRILLGTQDFILCPTLVTCWLSHLSQYLVVSIYFKTSFCVPVTGITSENSVP